MHDINIKVTETGCQQSPLLIGYQGENEVTRVIVDYSAWTEEFGAGSLTLEVMRSGDEIPYLAPLTIADGKAVWLVSNVDTGAEGAGAAGFVYTVGDQIKKSAVFRFFVGRDIGGDPGERPDPYERLIARIERLAAQTEENAVAAAESATDAAGSATTATEQAQAAATARAAAEAAQQAAETAQGAAETAQTAAEDARSAAASSATDAAGSATAASGSATAAAQSATEAGNAQAAAETAEQGAEAARQAIEDLGVEAHTDPQGPNVEKTVDPETGAVTLDFGFKPAGVSEVNGQTGAVSLDLDDIPDGAQYVRPTPAQVRQISTNADDIADIEDLIPNQATPQNQLADKDFVNSSINSSAAFFRGSFASHAALFAVPWQTSDPAAANYVTNNDYAYVADDETHNDEAWRYIYVLQPGGTDNGWKPQFRVNESPLTAAQLAALNSGATAEIIASIDDKYELPEGGMPSADMSDAVRASLQKADTALQEVPDTYRTAAAQDTIDAAQDERIAAVESMAENTNTALSDLGLSVVDGALCQTFNI